MLFQRICTFVTATVGLVAVAPSVLAGPLEPRQNQQITVTGVRGGVQVRKNIADLSNDELTVLLLGLRRFQAVDQNDPLSYFQIAGEWDALLPARLFALANTAPPHRNPRSAVSDMERL